jgi:hypothetical protein
MRCIELSAITQKAKAKIAEFGSVWKVIDERRDKFYFKSKAPHLYVIPFEPTQPHRNLGAMWIAEYNDSDYEFEDCAAPRIKRAA